MPNLKAYFSYSSTPSGAPSSTLLSSPPLISRYTFWTNLKIMFLAKLFMGIVELAPSVAKFHFNAPKWQQTIIVLGLQLTFITAYFFGQMMKGRDKRPWIFYSGLIGKGGLLFIAFQISSEWFLFICLIFYFSHTIFLTAWNNVLQRNYNPEWRGRLHGRTQAITSMVLIFSSLGFGALITYNHHWHHWIFPLAGVIGLFYTLMASRVKVRKAEQDEPSDPINLSMFRNTFCSLIQLLKRNKSFFYYQRNFFFYGLGYMMLIPGATLLMNEHLKMTPFEFALSWIVMREVCMCIASPWAGKFFDRYKTIKSAGVFILIKAVFALLLIASFIFQSKTLCYIACAVYGISNAGVNQAWNLGAMHFAGKKDVSPFMGVHITSVGLRAFIGMGIFLSVSHVFQDDLNFLVGVFLAGMILNLLCGLLMLQLAKKEDRITLVQT